MLPDLVIHGQKKLNVMRIWYSRLGDDIRERAEGIETLRYRPRKTLLLGFVLDVPGCKVDADRIRWSPSVSAVGNIRLSILHTRIAYTQWRP